LINGYKGGKTGCAIRVDEAGLRTGREIQRVYPALAEAGKFID
jgi:hypothetical protein